MNVRSPPRGQVIPNPERLLSLPLGALRLLIAFRDRTYLVTSATVKASAAREAPLWVPSILAWGLCGVLLAGVAVPNPLVAAAGAL